MTDINDVKFYYDHFDWRSSGEFWATRWDNTDMQWYGTILPRIHGFLPAERIVEIGPGKGRLSHFLEPFAEKQLILSDVTEACVQGCIERFKENKKVSCHLTDGTKLGPIAARSVDFVFSFFSLVHSDSATVQSYIVDLAEKLSDDGVAFIHHSNAGADLSNGLGTSEELNDPQDKSINAEKVHNFAQDSGLYCKSQELFGWDDDSVLSDCFSVIARPKKNSVPVRALIYNWEFSAEARRWGILARAYSPEFLGACP